MKAKIPPEGVNRWSEFEDYDAFEIKDLFRRRKVTLKTPLTIDGDTRTGEQTWVEQRGEWDDEWVPIYWDHEEGERI